MLSQYWFIAEQYYTDHHRCGNVWILGNKLSRNLKTDASHARSISGEIGVLAGGHVPGAFTGMSNLQNNRNSWISQCKTDPPELAVSLIIICSNFVCQMREKISL